MKNQDHRGWKKLLDGYPRSLKDARFSIQAYSEFMPPPQLGRRPGGESDADLFSENDYYGWQISEIEEEYQLQPGLADLAHQIVNEIVQLGQGQPAYRICGHDNRNLRNNPYWTPELAEKAGKLPHERYLTLLPLALSKTQDDKGRHRWTFFGSSEQGPEQVIRQSFYSAPGQERPPAEALSFWLKMLSTVYGESCREPSDLHRIGFRILPSSPDSSFPYWSRHPWPSSCKPFLWQEPETVDNVRYLLTFRPFSLLSEEVRRRYLSGQLVLLPFPGSLVFWGMPEYLKLQEELPLALQLPLLKTVARHDGPEGIKILQSGGFHEPGRNSLSPEVHERFLNNTYKRTSRWDRFQRYENEAVLSTIEDTIAKTLFSTDSDILKLYNKPMARNCQIWTGKSHLLLNGPDASRKDMERAAEAVSQGGTFHYRFLFPPMQVGAYQVFWHRPLAAYWSAPQSQVKILDDSPQGYLTAYNLPKLNLSQPVELWPRIQNREIFRLALRSFEHLQEHYRHQTAFNIIRLLDLANRWAPGPLPCSLAREILRLPEHESLETWLSSLPGKSRQPESGEIIREELTRRLEHGPDSAPATSWPGMPPTHDIPSSLTFSNTAQRDFEEAWWKDISKLSHGEFLNKNNADCVKDAPTLARLTHLHRDLDHLGDYLLQRHLQSIEQTQMSGQAACGELRFHWLTDFDFSLFGGWKANQEGTKHERDLLVVIPGQNRREAVILADHYDTAFMEDLYDKSRGGTGARIASAGADDNGSATATLLQAAPIFLKMSRQNLLQRDIWLVHLTGEEFPADCLGSRSLCQAIAKHNLRLQLADGQSLDLSQTKVTGVLVMDMIGHNRETAIDTFQISPGQGEGSLQMAYQAHLANIDWNLSAQHWNRNSERRGKGRSQRSSKGFEVPALAEHPLLQGEVRLFEDPHSSLYNTDGQIFSDCGLPVVLLMENYDIKRSGYHDTQDTLADIDLDYGSALAAIAIETIARAATQSSI